MPALSPSCIVTHRLLAPSTVIVVLTVSFFYLQVRECTALLSGLSSTAIMPGRQPSGLSASCSTTWSAATFPLNWTNRYARPNSTSSHISVKVRVVFVFLSRMARLVTSDYFKPPRKHACLRTPIIITQCVIDTAFGWA